MSFSLSDIPNSIPKRIFIIIALIGVVVSSASYTLFTLFAQETYITTTTASGNSTSVRSINPNVPAFNTFYVYTGFEQSSPEPLPSFAYLRFSNPNPDFTHRVTQTSVKIHIDAENIIGLSTLIDEQYVLELWLVDNTWTTGLVWNTQNTIQPMSVLLGNCSTDFLTDLDLIIDIPQSNWQYLESESFSMVLKFRSFNLPFGTNPTEAELVCSILKTDIIYEQQYYTYMGSTEIIMWIITAIGIGVALIGFGLYLRK